jgi:hypothetical protein
MPTERTGVHGFDPLEPASGGDAAPDASSSPARDALTAAMTGRQAKRAALTHERLLRVDGSDLPAEWAAILIRAAGTPRSTGVNGREGILSPLEAQNAALAYRALSPCERDALAELVGRARVTGHADASPAQALILKALAARRASFADVDPAARSDALHELTRFAGGIQGLDFGNLMRNTSLLDIDETVDTQRFDPRSLEDRPGAPADRPLLTTGADNDGLFQRYEMTCGPASINRVVGNNLGVTYTCCSLYREQDVKMGSDQAATRSPDYVRSHLDRIEQNLAEGIDIVLGTAYPDHFWSMSSVEGEAPNRQFLVHDTWSGKTRWVDEPALIDGSFARAFLGERKTHTFIDVLYLVVAQA